MRLFEDTKYPIVFYFRGMFIWIFPVAMLIGILIKIRVISILFGFALIVPWCVFWGYKAYKAYLRDVIG